jgi:hypothetical protein
MLGTTIKMVLCICAVSYKKDKFHLVTYNEGVYVVKSYSCILY